MRSRARRFRDGFHCELLRTIVAQRHRHVSKPASAREAAPRSRHCDRRLRLLSRRARGPTPRDWCGSRTRRLVLLEPNAAPGLTNRLLAPIVDEVWVAPYAAQPRAGAKYRTTGIPIRATLRALPRREDALARLGLDPSLRTLVAVGGSQGARSINDALIRLLRDGGLPSGWQLLALTGTRDFERTRSAVARRARLSRRYGRRVCRRRPDSCASRSIDARRVGRAGKALDSRSRIRTRRRGIRLRTPHALRRRTRRRY